jgi:hypothetical protein
MQGTALVIKASLCLASVGFYISNKNSYPDFISVLVCGQSIIYNHSNSF